jgi:pimeloyl-ACP methyl ester carboxylesterase
MPYANSNGVKIYYEVEGEGPPLMLAHGVTADLTAWKRFGYVDALKNDFRLILFDFRGHGRSDKPHEISAYGPKWIEDPLTVLDQLGIDQTHYLGYSMGTAIGFRLAIYQAERFLSFFLSSNTPYALPEAFRQQQRGFLELMKLRLTDPAGYLIGVEKFFHRPITQAEKDRWLAIDAEAFISITSSDLPPLTDQDLGKISSPCLVYCGDLEPFYLGAKESVNHIPQAKFVSAPGLDHGAAWARSDLMLPHIKEFLAQVSKT